MQAEEAAWPQANAVYSRRRWCKWKSQEKKQRAATKHDVNAAMEKPVRGAIATVTVGAGNEAEVLPQPIEVAKECGEWGARRMSLIQPEVVPSA